MLSRACVVACAAGVAVGLSSAVWASAPTESEKVDATVVKTKPDSVEAARAQVRAVASQFRGEPATSGPRVIYGADDRHEVYEETDPMLRSMAEAACVVAFPSEVTDNGDGTYTLSTSPWTSAGGGTLCTDEPYRGQPTIGFCSGFLVGPDIVATAGHCAGPSGVTGSTNVVFIFGFQINDSDETGPMVVPAEYVYFGTANLSYGLSGGLDHSVIQLDRPVTGINPVPIRREGVVANGDPMVVIGHPATLPKKIAGGAIVQDNQGSTPWYQSNLDTYGGNSGSMVINANTYTVEGILVRGAPDYTSEGGCVVSNEVPDTGNTGSGLEFEECSKTISFADVVPPLGLAVGPGGSVTHIGAVGGPFTNPSEQYTLSNPTGDPIDISVEVTGPDASLFSLSSITKAETATIAGGETSMITVTLDTTAAAMLSAGEYTADVVFTDLTNGRDTVVTHTVEVGVALVDVVGNDLFGGGPVGGPFNISGMYEVTSERPTPSDIMVTSDVAWLDIDGGVSSSFTLTGTGDSETVSVSVNSAADALPAGLATGTISFTNTTSGDVTTFEATVDVGRFAYTATDVPVSISDLATFTSSITVPDGYCVGDVDVDLDLTHTYSGDLIITLTSPEGTSVTLQNEGGGSDAFTPRYYDDDDAMNTAPEGPGMLSDFDGEGVGGTWTLTIEDDASGDQGTLNGWQLRVAASGDVCPPMAFDGSLSLPQNGLDTVDLMASSESGSYTLTITTLPALGVLWEPGVGSITSTPYELSGTQVTYRATPGMSGSDTFGFTASDDGLVSDEATFAVSIGGPGQVAYFGLDADPGWTTEGDWAFGQPTGGGGAGFASGPDPTSGYTGPNVYGYNLSGDYGNSISSVEYLTTGPISTGGVDGLSVNFRRWLGMESSSFDHANFQVSADGGSWVTVWEHDGGSFGDDAWILVEYDLEALVGSPDSIQLRWGLGPTDTSVVYPGWNIDDIEITGIGVGDANPADLNTDDNLNNTDINLFVNAFLSGDPLADMNGDGFLNNTDINLFVNYFIGG